MNETNGIKRKDNIHNIFFRYFSPADESEAFRGGNLYGYPRSGIESHTKR